MSDQVKQVLLGDRRFSIRGLGPADPYFSGVGDGYGSELYDFIKSNVAESHVILDIGANIGITACIASQVGGVVHAFEPQPEVYGLLKQNVAENGLASVRTWNLAVGSTPGMVRFSGGSAYGFISNDESAPQVQVVTIDDFVKAQGVPRVDFIKIDVEGFEPHVLEGARDTIERFNPIIYMELNSWALLSAGNANPRDFLDRLFAKFAEIYVVEHGGFRPGLSALHVLHDNIVRGGSVDDLILLKRARPLKASDASPATAAVESVALKPVAVEAGAAESTINHSSRIAELEATIRNLHASTSWRITKPLRNLKRLFSL